MNAAALGPLQLTRRDQAILTMVYEYGGVTVQHVRRRFFPSPGAQSPCYRRIARLVEQDYLTAVRLPSASGVGSGPLFLTLGPAGRPLLAEALGLSRTDLGEIPHRFAPLFVQHHLAICDTRLAFELGSVGSVVAVIEWVPERELKRAPLRLTDPKTKVVLPIVPDAALTLQLPDGRSQEVYLEQDMGTIAPRRMRTKVRLYLAQRSDGEQLPVVMMITTTKGRREALARWIEEEAAWLRASAGMPADTTRFLLTTQGMVAENTIVRGSIWQVVGGPAAFSLLPSEYRERENAASVLLQPATA